MTAAAKPRDAATVLLLRDSAQGVEVFMVKRNTMVDFMAGAHVFPGGKVDAADSDPALLERLRGALHPSFLPKHYIAAIRETFEEAGVLLAEGLEEGRLGEARRALASGENFLSVMMRLGASFDAERLVAWTRWVTPAASPKRFDARFFLAAAPAEQLARHDEHETTASLWIVPGEALDRAQRGAMLIAPATYKCLSVLARYRSVAEGIAAARTSSPRVWCPIVQTEGGRRFVILSDDGEHPDRYERMPGPTRLVFDGGRFLPA